MNSVYPSKGMRFASVVILALSCLLVITNIALQRQNKNLISIINEIHAERGPQPGTTLTLIQGEGINGKSEAFDFTAKGKKSLLLVFSPTCKYCEENWSKWNQLLESAADRVNIVLVDVTSGADLDFIKKRDLDKYTYIKNLPAEIKWLYDFRQTPQTILLSNEGKI